MSKLLEDIKEYKIAIILVFLYCFFTQLIFGYMCPFRILFNVDCPGCGLTRATFALLKGNIGASLHYNYSCIFWLLAIILFIVDRYIKELKIKPFPVLFIIAAVVTSIRYILIVFFKIYIF